MNLALNDTLVRPGKLCAGFQERSLGWSIFRDSWSRFCYFKEFYLFWNGTYTSMRGRVWPVLVIDSIHVPRTRPQYLLVKRSNGLWNWALWKGNKLDSCSESNSGHPNPHLVTNSARQARTSNGGKEKDQGHGSGRKQYWRILWCCHDIQMCRDFTKIFKGRTVTCMK